MSWNNSRCINSNYPLMMNSQWNDAPFNEDDSYLDEERPHPDPPPLGFAAFRAKRGKKGGGSRILSNKNQKTIN